MKVEQTISLIETQSRVDCWDDFALHLIDVIPRYHNSVFFQDTRRAVEVAIWHISGYPQNGKLRYDVLILNWIAQILQSSFIFQRPRLILIFKHKNSHGVDIKNAGIKVCKRWCIFSGVSGGGGGGGYAVYLAWTFQFINIDRGSEHFALLIFFTHTVYKFYFFHCISFHRERGGGGGTVERTGGDGGG